MLYWTIIVFLMHFPIWDTLVKTLWNLAVHSFIALIIAFFYGKENIILADSAQFSNKTILFWISLSFFVNKVETLRKKYEVLLSAILNFDIFNAIFMKASVFFRPLYTLIMMKNHAGPNDNLLPLKLFRLNQNRQLNGIS